MLNLTMSPEINEITAALVKAQAAFPVLRPDSKVEIRKDREHRYASLGAVLEAIRGPLSANGIAYTQVLADMVVTPARKRVKNRPATPESRGTFLVTTLLHTSGQWIGSRFPIPLAIRIDPQAVGSYITYARRYSIAAITGLAVEDDDGQAARGKVERRNDPVRAPGPGPGTNREPGGDDEPAPTRAPVSTRPAVRKHRTGVWLAGAASRQGVTNEFIAIGQKLGYPADFAKWTEEQVDNAIKVRTEGFQQ